MSDWLGIASVLGVLVALMGGLSVLKAKLNLHAEITRKLVHVLMGCVTLSFPWLFTTPWPVVCIGLFSVGLIAATKLLPAMRQSMGGALGDVDRSSWGEIYFPIAVMTLFILSGGDKLLYGIPVLILTLADATSALIGVQYGQAKYRTSDGSKSVEGSLAFFTVAFLSTQLPLLLMSNTGRLESVLIALVIGLLVMILEAVGTVGLDNLLIPFGAYIFLKIYLTFPPSELLLRVVVLLLLMMGAFIWRRRTDLNGSAILLSTLVAYVFWALGGWLWVLPPLIVFASHTLQKASPPNLADADRVYGSRAVLCTAGAGLLWLFVAKVLANPQLAFVSSVAFALHLAIIGYTRQWLITHPEGARSAASMRLLIQPVLWGWGLVMWPWLWATYQQPLALTQALVSLAVVALSTGVFALTQHQLDQFPTKMSRWVYRGVLVGVTSALGLLAL
jgi:phytol kinase